MNRSQKLLTVAALALFCASITLAPWADKRADYTYRPIFFAPSGCHLQWQNLIVEWLAIGILYGWLFWLFKHMEITRKIVLKTLKAILLVIIAIVTICAFLAYLYNPQGP